MRNFYFLILLITLFLSSCEREKKDYESLNRKVHVSELKGFSEDDLILAFEAFLRSCKGYKSSVISPEIARYYSAEDSFNDNLRLVCEVALEQDKDDKSAIKDFFLEWFIVYEVGEVMFTGYFEPILEGSLERHGDYTIPLYGVPSDLVVANLSDFRKNLSGRIIGRVSGNRLVNYHSRAEIMSGALSGKAQPLLWVKDEIGAFFLSIQGSGLVILEDGNLYRLSYAGTNGRRYYAIGGALISRGVLSYDELSMQSIISWLRSNPRQVKEILSLNHSYIFFHKQLAYMPSPKGSQGVRLTAGRSLAVDRRKLPLGLPIWVDVELPNGEVLRRLMVSQDTGGAILGWGRADIFWGSGPQAAEIAGRMKHNGRSYVFLPKILSHVR